MKTPIISLLVLVLLATMCVTLVNAGWAGSSIACRNISINEDPNDPGPESGYIGSQINCVIDENDPNDPAPGPESI